MDRDGARRTGLLLGGGAVVALAAGGLIALSLIGGRHGETTAPPPASRGGLVIDPNQSEPAPVASTKTLRCFVGGQFVGESTLADCASRNGVATDKLDVGVDQTGAPAASQAGAAVVRPLPPREPPRPAPKPEPAASAGGPAGACWRYADGSWRKLPNDIPLGACVRTLFDGRCEKPGQALYGRWAQQTIRLVPGRVEISPDNRNFRSLAEQGPGCSVSAAG